MYAAIGVPNVKWGGQAPLALPAGDGPVLSWIVVEILLLW